MTTVRCPLCREQVSIPSSVGSQTLVRCPLCQEQYALVDALKGLPPLLIVVPQTAPLSNQVPTLSAADQSVYDEHLDEPVDEELDDLSDDSRDPAGTWSVEEFRAPQTATDAPREVAMFEGWNDEPEEKPDRTDTYDRGASTATAEPRTSTMPMRHRPRRKQAGPIRSFVQVIGGGVLGLVIAQLILWWMPGSWAKDKRDPLAMASRVAKFAPFLVPSEVLASRSSSEQSVAARQQPAKLPAGISPTKEMRFGMQGQEAESKASEPDAAKNATENNASDSDASTNRNSTGDPATWKPDPNGPPHQNRWGHAPSGGGIRIGLAKGPNDATPENKTEADSKGLQTETIVETTASDIGRPAVVEGQPLTELLASARQADDVWNKGASVPKEERLQQLIALYSRYSKLGESLVHTNREDPAFVREFPKIRQAMDELAQQPDKLNYIGKYGSYWINQERPHDGVVLYGTVMDYQPQPLLSVMRVKLPPPTEMEIVVLRDGAAEPVPTNSRVLVFGALVTDPRNKIKGYQGQEPIAAQEGYSVMLPAAQ